MLPTKPFNHKYRNSFDFDQEDSSFLVPQEQIAVSDTWNKIQPAPDMKLLIS